MLKKIYLILLGLLLLRLGLYFAALPHYSLGTQLEVSGQIGSEPSVDRGRQIFKLDRFSISTSAKTVFHFGDRVEVSGIVGKDNWIDEGSVILTAKYVPNVWEKAAIVVRTSIIKTYQNILPKQEANLFSGVVLGSVGLDRSFKAKLANVGLTHVVAASGMNVTLFSGFIAWLLSVLRLGKMQKVLVSILFILFYSTITGFEPPIVRASLMVGIMMLATIVGRQGSGFWGLVVAAYLMLWASPNLLTSASFLLSFSSMMGQIFLGSFVGELPKGGKGRPVVLKWTEQTWDFFRKNFFQSFLAVVFTLPVVLWFFAKFSLVSLLSNMLTLWTVEPLMILGGIVGLLGIVSQDLARIVVLPAGPLLAYFLAIVDLLGKDYFLLNLKVSGWMFPVGYYLLLAGFVWWWQGLDKRI